MDEKITITATFLQDTKRYHRFEIDENTEGITGNLYVAKSEDVPDELVVTLKGKGPWKP